jgi:hypothetical protein
METCKAASGCTLFHEVLINEISKDAVNSSFYFCYRVVLFPLGASNDHWDFRR